MANYIENFNGKLDWAMPFQRTGKFPLDRSCMFSSYDDAVLYASGGADTRGLGGTSYVGQLIVVFENDVVTVYKINADRTIEALTSESGVNADVLDLQNQLNAEIKARKEAIDALDKTIDETNGNFDISITQTNGLFDSLTISDIHLTSGYSSVVYPEVDSTTFTSAKANDTLDVAIKTVDQNVATLVQEVLNNEEVVASSLKEIKQSVGLNENLKYVVDSNSTYISEATTFSEADSLLDAALANEVANRQDAIDALDSTVTSSTTNVGVTVVQTNGKLSSVTLTQNDIASASGLSAEIAARKAVDGQTGQTYAKNTAYTHISAATSLNDADIKLNNAITAETKARQDAIDALDANYTQTISVDSNGKATTNHIGFDLSQLDGKITNFSITEKDIASAYDLSQEIAARKAVNGQTGQTYAANTTYKHISAATSLNDADIRLNNAITAETKARQDAIDAMNSTIDKSNGNFDITVNQVNGLLESLEISDITLSENYVNVVYPEVGSTIFTSAKNGDTLDSAIKTVDQNVATLVQEVLNNEEVVAAAMTEIKESVGLNENLKYVKNTSATYISEATTFSEADSLLDAALANEVANRQGAIDSMNSTVTSSTTNVGVTVVQTNGKLSSVTLTQSDIASASALTAEIAARKAVDGQTGQTYAKNSGAIHISAATSLNDADIKLNDAITAETKARQDAIDALDATVSGNGTHVDVTVSQLNGKITGVSVAESDIASASGLSAEIAARKAIDGQTGQTYVKNSGETYISAATSLNDADIKLNNAIANLKITSATTNELSSLGTNVKEAYKLIDGNSTQHGNWIKIYKDSALQEVYLGLSNDTINATTGVITKNTVPSGQIAQSLNFKYQLTDGTYSLVKVDISKFLAETEYADGLQVSNGVISVKKDSSSESFLSVSSNGVKLSGVQNAIDTAVNNLDATVSGNGTHVDVTVSQLNGKITGVSVAESDIASAAALSAEIAARKAVDGQTGQTYAANTTYKHISAATSLNDADVKLNNAITAETKARQDAIDALDATVSGNGTHVDVTVSQLNGKITGVSVSESDIASASALTAEIAARKAVDGQTGQTYAANTTYKHISAATSLNNADMLLNNAITAETKARQDAITAETKARQDAIDALDATVSGNGTHVDVTVSQLNGKITGVSVAESDIASAAALTAEIAARKAVDGQTGQTYVKNTAYTHISAATSLNDADIRLNNAITAETKARQDAIDALDATVSGNGTHVDVTVSQLNGKITGVSVAESDIASASGLSAEITARKAVDGQTGQTYAANTAYKHISAATSLNNADMLLNNAITAETNSRQLVDDKIISSVGLNSDGTFKKPTTAQTSGYTTAATSILDAIIILDNQVEENETVTAYALTDLNDRLEYYEGHNNISSLVNIPTTKRLCIATLSSSQTLSLNGSISDGRELHIIIHNTSVSDITITIPSSIKNLVGENLIIGGSSYGEINLTSDGTNVYYRGIGK